VRAYTTTRVVDIIEQATRNGAKVVSFADDSFGQNSSWSLQVLVGLQQRRIQAYFRAQTRATSVIWPLLQAMRSVGFFELAFGVESFLPERVEFLGKARNGCQYIAEAEETIVRTIMAGICPVVYLILADPLSTLTQLASEFDAIVQFLSRVYSRTSALPRISFSPVLLPLASTEITRVFPTQSESLVAGTRCLVVPRRFRLRSEVEQFLVRADEETRSLPRRRENLAVLPIYFRALAKAASEIEDKEGSQALEKLACAVSSYECLLKDLENDVQLTLKQLVANLCGRAPLTSTFRSDFTRFGSYYAGVERLHRELEELVSVHSSPEE